MNVCWYEITQLLTWIFFSNEKIWNLKLDLSSSSKKVSNYIGQWKWKSKDSNQTTTTPLLWLPHCLAAMKMKHPLTKERTKKWQCDQDCCLLTFPVKRCLHNPQTTKSLNKHSMTKYTRPTHPSKQGNMPDLKGSTETKGQAVDKPWAGAQAEDPAERSKLKSPQRENGNAGSRTEQGPTPVTIIR